MTQLNLSQIEDKLNAEFAGEARRLIFWYDAGGDFVQDIDSLRLSGAKILHLKEDNQFYIKHFLECVDRQTSYLVYAPFEKPPVRENHLADTIRYSKEFFADRASLLALDLGVEQKYKAVLQHYIKFFANKERTQRFYELDLGVMNKEAIEVGLMSVLCKSRTASFEEVVRIILTEDSLEENRFLGEFEKYDLLDSFWQQCRETFGYADEAPTLHKLVYGLFVTYMAKSVSVEVPQLLQRYFVAKGGNAVAFLDSLMNSVIYCAEFDRLSELVSRNLDMNRVLDGLSIDSLGQLELFKSCDIHIVRWMTERLSACDTAAKLGDMDIPALCKKRRQLHFGKTFASHYYVLENAYHIISAADFKPEDALKEIYERYIDSDYVIDRRYRYFYLHYDKIENDSPYEGLKKLVDNIYINRFLNPLCAAWAGELTACEGDTGIPRQLDFYRDHVRGSRERTVVIISDGMRYEVGKTLFEKLSMDEKFTAKITAAQTVLPSYTRLGMAALLPHKSIELDGQYRVLADGTPCDDLKSREKILQSCQPASKAIQFDAVKTVKAARELTTGQDVVYLYHNQIDARGDKAITEDEVFAACEEAVEEICAMLRRLTSANNTRFLITSDHGFLYKRAEIAESDKISVDTAEKGFSGKRYVIADEAVKQPGLAHIPLGKALRNDDTRVISLPVGSDIIKEKGSGQNYVHGGMSLQEMVIPVIEVKANRTAARTRTASIAMISLIHKITNLSINLDFIQSEAVSEEVKETRYSLYFVSETGEKISGDNLYVADKKDDDAGKRIFRLKFNFKNQTYDSSLKYYLIAYDLNNDVETIRHEVRMDLAFADDFGFDI